MRDLASVDFLEHERNLVLIGGTGTGKTHIAVGIASACVDGDTKGSGSSTRRARQDRQSARKRDPRSACSLHPLDEARAFCCLSGPEP